jgi:DNA-binding CsgD family transcriptional regulator
MGGIIAEEIAQARAIKIFSVLNYLASVVFMIASESRFCCRS